VRLFEALESQESVFIMSQRPNKTSAHQTKGMQHWKIISIWLILYDIFMVNMAYFIALWLRFDCQFSKIPESYLYAWLQFVPVYSAVCLVVFTCLRLYQTLWRFASFSELLRVFWASVITAVLHVSLITVFWRLMPASYYIIGTVLQFFLVIGIRFSYRLVLLVRSNRRTAGRNAHADRVMLIGAGAAGQMILRDINTNHSSNQRVVCIVDDNPNKWNRYLDGVPIVGGRDDILSNVHKHHVDKIYLAIPSATAEQKRDILEICKESGCEMKILPGMYQFVSGHVGTGSMKDVAVEDLLGRDPIRVDLREIFHHLTGKVILVTGGGGSIGSELCRQIAGHHPKQLIIFDVYENNAYDIEQELKEEYPHLNLTVLIGSVRDSRRINQVFATYKPEIVYHAAAHKHVPLMEASPCEAIKNNTIGTYKTAYAAMINGCARFVLVSTDKAVNPTNIMGASKRLCEMVVQSFDKVIREHREDCLPILHAHAADDVVDMTNRKAIVGKATTEFVAVRFGNVLGSNGSVIPLFKKQIAKGGPVTVTHPDIIRYFMTIPEAVSLVLQAGVYARGGEIFVLDMGAPVKIDTLARNLIKLSGLQPDVDVMISYTGLRPGEKLYEEKLMSEEGLQTTPNRLIHVGSPIPFDTDRFLLQLQALMKACHENEDDIGKLVEEMVPSFHPAGAHGSEKKGAAYEAQLKTTAGVS